MGEEKTVPAGIRAGLGQVVSALSRVKGGGVRGECVESCQRWWGKGRMPLLDSTYQTILCAHEGMQPFRCIWHAVSTLEVRKLPAPEGFVQTLKA